MISKSYNHIKTLSDTSHKEAQRQQHAVRGTNIEQLEEH